MHFPVDRHGAPEIGFGEWRRQARTVSLSGVFVALLLTLVWTAHAGPSPPAS
jgi:hypothetical protein